MWNSRVLGPRNDSESRCVILRCLMSHHSYRPNRYNLHYVHSGHGMSVDWWALGILLFEMIAGHPPFYDTNAFGIYQRVLDGHVTFSNLFTAQAKALIKALLKPDRTKRLGCTSTGGNGVRRHKWFSSTNWVALQNCQVSSRPRRIDDRSFCSPTCGQCSIDD